MQSCEVLRLELHVTVEAGASIGNTYNYYNGKEEIYLSVIQRYELHMEELRTKSLGSMKDFFDPARIAEYGTRDPGNRLRQPKRRIHGADV
jgi:AcrR family transcriptional regulator